MNEFLENKGFFNNIKTKIENNFKFLIIFVISIVVFIASIQLYFFYENKQILKSSISYNQAKSFSSDLEFLELMNKLSEENNFYGVLSTLEKIQIKLNSKDYESAHNDYIFLLNKKNLNELYKSAIAIHASYSFLNQLNISSEQNSLNNRDEIFNYINKVEDFLSYIDKSLNSYEGFRLEISFLILILKSEFDQNSFNDEIKLLFNEIINKEDLPATIKDRVRKIYEFQKYK
tara:strand:- start:1255 stop:1950 length:696 start_codon:yes stop_codon:yes gene_type:complete